MPRTLKRKHDAYNAPVRAKKRRTTKPVVPRGISSKHIIINRVVDYEGTIGASDTSLGFEFTTTTVEVDAGAPVTLPVPGASEIQLLFDLARVQKVEVTFLGGSNSRDMASTPAGDALPRVYSCVDYTEGGRPTLDHIRQQDDCRIHRFDQIWKQTIYPKFSPSTNYVDIGTNEMNLYPYTTGGSANKWKAFKMFIDGGGLSANQTFTVSFKIFYECRNPK